MNEINNPEILKELKRAETDLHLERVRNIYKFDFFFTGLVFAIVSFAMQFPVKSACLCLRIAESFSWILFLVVGICALYVCGGFIMRHTDPVLEKRQQILPKVRWWMWSSFVVAVVILVFVKIIDLVYMLPK